MFDTTYTLLKIIVQRLKVQKLLVSYSLDYPIKVRSSFNNKMTPWTQSFVKKKVLKKYDWSITSHYIFTHLHLQHIIFIYFSFSFDISLGL
jgi:hypothetical protein